MKNLQVDNKNKKFSSLNNSLNDINNILSLHSI